MRPLFRALILFLLCVAGTAGAQPPRYDAFPPYFIVQSWHAPAPFNGVDGIALVYELYVTNAFNVPVTLKELSAAGGGGARFTFSGEALKGMISTFGAEPASAASLEIAPGGTAMVFVWLPLGEQPVPRELRHEIRATAKPAPDQELVMQVTPMRVSLTPAVTIHAPLAGPNWIAAEGPSNISTHRRTWLSFGGRPRISQRFAIDFMQFRVIDGRTALYTGAARDNRNWFSYGHDVYAVADGTVVVARDGIPDNTSGEPTAVPITLDTLAGNSLVIDIGNGRFACYAHLIPGSLTVRPGDRVKAGQIIGKLGNSGNSVAPHLHFHVTDRPSFLDADGEPYRLPRMRGSQAHYDGNPLDETFRMTLDTARADYANQMPVQNMVVDFPQR